MRVIAETIEKAKMTDIDPRPFLEVLASPYTSDRNKALFVLTTLAESPQSKQVILEEGGAQLLALMRLQQPNNHGEAYTILKKISGQDFDSEDLGAWSSWVRHAKPKHRGTRASAV